MANMMHTIEIDAETAALLVRRAAEHGLTTSQLIAALVQRDDGVDDRSELASEAPTVPHNEVVRWLETWGMPAFESWAKRP